MVALGTTGLDVFPLSLGGNVFGWTSDQETSFRVLDEFLDGGGNFIDTADAYSQWAPGNVGGESETILGEWLTSRGVRDRIVLATKVSALSTAKGLSAGTIERAVEDSLRRLQTDVIDLYWAHYDDADTPLEETVAAFDRLVRAGKVRALGASNFTADRLEQALKIADSTGTARYLALQPHYNLVERGIEDDLLPLAQRYGLATVPYYALASGFLTGKYRADGSAGSGGDSPRAGAARKYLDGRGRAVLPALDEVAAETGASVTAVSLAWLRTRPTVVAPIASARVPEQVADLLAGARLELTPAQAQRLTDASA
ncbi:aldo/keto reductase [Nakamurella leprariae]|uniref:Aldo/keto reductase n=1 Tax=Nakamurella leprariae TaxID=2803911 RepID=A0A938Y637_9ACTN|nr:aldo/keto reductase [Nakamurella leprariae]MBM9466455.1 aldo/keto reductase [Nakamurella leprariae]